MLKNGKSNVKIISYLDETQGSAKR